MTAVYKIILILFGIFLAGCFAGSETGIYCLSRSRLRLAVKGKSPFAALLDRLLNDTQGLILSLLIGTNLTYYLTTSLVTYMFLSWSRTSYSAEIYAAVIMTPVLFVFSELIPKNIFIHHANALLLRLSPGIWLFHKICTFTGVVPLLKFIPRLFRYLMKSPSASQPLAIGIKRRYISQIIQETTEEGLLSPAQRDIINRLINIPDIPVAAVMTPLNKVQMVELSTSAADILDILRQKSFSRLVVYENNLSNVVGFVNIYNILTSEAASAGIGDFLKPITNISHDTSVAGALNFMRTEKHKIALVTRSKKTIGIITIKDLIEELVGELTN